MDTTRRLEDLTSGVVVGVVTVAYSLSFAALIFSGELASALPYGIMAALTGAAISAVVVSRFSSLAGATAGLDTPTMAVVATMAAAVSSRIGAGDIPDSMLFDHVLAAVISSTLATGVVLFCLGHFRLGQWMRFVPYPVVGGFLAASGWLLTMGAVKVMTGTRPVLDGFTTWPDAGRLGHLLAGLAFAAMIATVRRVSRHYAVVPLAVGLGAVAVHAGLRVAGLDLLQAQEDGWLLRPIEAIAPWNPWRPDVWASLDWPSMILHAGELGAAVGVTAVAVLLNATGLEVDQRTNADIDRELKANGTANLVSGLLGGMIGNLSLNRSRLNIQAGGRSALSGVAVAAVCVAFMAFGQRIAGFVPTPVLGGLLMFLGLSMLYDWIGRASRRLSLGDYLLVLVILVCIVNLGYLEGALAGVVAASVMFVLRYSRVRVVKHRMTAREYSSYVERSSEDRQALNANGDRVLVFQLQGYLFFGTANSLFEEVREAVSNGAGGPECSVVLDFRLVSGSDSSAVFSFVKMLHLLERSGRRLLLSAVRPELRSVLEDEGVITGHAGGAIVFDTLDECLEFAEDRLLDRVRGEVDRNGSLDEWLMSELNDADATGRIQDYLDRIELAPGEYVCRQGEPSDEIYLAVSGRISIILAPPGRAPIRLRSMGSRTMVGEMGFFRDVIRTASVIADEPTVLYSLDRDRFEQMRREDAVACTGFQRFVIRVLSNRLEFANSEVSALQR